MTENSVLKFIVWSIIGVTMVVGSKFERMVVSKMRMSDLETSGSGYAYSHQQGFPASYVRYTNHGGQLYYDAPKPVHYISPPVAGPSLAKVLYPNLSPATFVYAPTLTPKVLPASYQKYEAHRSAEDDKDEDEDKKSEFRVRDKWRPDITHASHDAAYKNDAGETYDAAKYAEHGAKGETEYETRNEFDEGESGAHFEDNHKGHYNDDGGREKAHSETEAHYEQHGEEEKGAKGENYGQIKYHKKGHKTSGFHNVYHKDEYKKDTDFYDEKHESGNVEKYGKNAERHINEEGEVKKGLRHDSAHHRQAHANQESVDKGRIEKHRQGHSHKKGDDRHYSKGSEYAGKKREFGHHKHGFLD